MVMGEHEKRLHELSLIALADSNPGSLGRPGQAGQQQRGQDGDDGDYHQEFNKREAAVPGCFHHHFHEELGAGDQIQLGASLGNL